MPTTLDKLFIDRISEDAQYGNATGIRALVACAYTNGFKELTEIVATLRELVAAREIIEVDTGLYELHIEEHYCCAGCGNADCTC